MGRPRVEGLTLDAGALIGIERGDPRIRDMVDRVVSTSRGSIRVAAPTISEVWRDGGPRQATLSRFLAACLVVPCDVALARAAGALLGQAGSSGTVDAIVVACAARYGDTVVTGDPDDMVPLAAAAGVRIIAL